MVLGVLWSLAILTFVFVLLRLYTRLRIVEAYGIDDHFFNSAFVPSHLPRPCLMDKKPTNGYFVAFRPCYCSTVWRLLLLLTTGLDRSCKIFLQQVILERPSYGRRWGRRSSLSPSGYPRLPWPAFSYASSATTLNTESQLSSQARHWAFLSVWPSSFSGWTAAPLPSFGTALYLVGTALRQETMYPSWPGQSACSPTYGMPGSLGICFGVCKCLLEKSCSFK